MKCRDAGEMLNSYFDNKTDPMNDRLLAEHIRSCPKCREEYGFLVKYRSMLKTVRPVSPPENYLAELHSRIEHEKEKNTISGLIQKAKSFTFTFHFPLEAAGVLAIAAVVFFLYRPFFSGKVDEQRAGYTVESPPAETAVKIEKQKGAAEHQKPFTLKKVQPAATEKKEIPLSGNIAEEAIKEDMKDKRSFSASDNISAASEKSYDTSKSIGMKKSRNAEREKDLAKSEEESFAENGAGGIVSDAKNHTGSKQDSAPSREFYADRVFREYEVSVIKKDLSRPETLYYRVRVNSDRHPALVEKLKENFKVEEKVLKQDKTRFETELFLKEK